MSNINKLNCLPHSTLTPLQITHNHINQQPCNSESSASAILRQSRLIWHRQLVVPHSHCGLLVPKYYNFDDTYNIFRYRKGYTRCCNPRIYVRYVELYQWFQGIQIVEITVINLSENNALLPCALRGTTQPYISISLNQVSIVLGSACHERYEQTQAPDLEVARILRSTQYTETILLSFWLGASQDTAILYQNIFTPGLASSDFIAYSFAYSMKTSQPNLSINSF